MGFIFFLIYEFVLHFSLIFTNPQTKMSSDFLWRGKGVQTNASCYLLAMQLFPDSPGLRFPLHRQLGCHLCPARQQLLQANATPHTIHGAYLESDTDFVLVSPEKKKKKKMTGSQPARDRCSFSTQGE